MFHRVFLGRLGVITRYTEQRKIYVLSFTIDFLTAVSIAFGWAEYHRVKVYCSLSYYMFYLFAMIYMTCGFCRIVLTVFQFMCGRRFWRWAKRQSCLNFLNEIEYEQRAEFSIYKAEDYIKLVSREMDAP